MRHKTAKNDPDLWILSGSEQVPGANRYPDTNSQVKNQKVFRFRFLLLHIKMMMNRKGVSVYNMRMGLVSNKL